MVSKDCLFVQYYYSYGTWCQTVADLAWRGHLDKEGSSNDIRNILGGQDSLGNLRLSTSLHAARWAPHQRKPNGADDGIHLNRICFQAAPLSSASFQCFLFVRCCQLVSHLSQSKLNSLA